MKLLAVGDLHVKHDNFEDIDIVFNDLKKIYTEEKFEAIVLLGDILHHHEKVFTQSLNKALDFIKKCSELGFTYILVGNHDMISNSQFLTDCHWMNVLKTCPNIKVVDTVIEVDNIILCPFVAPGRFLEALDTLGINKWRDKKVIFAHQEFLGCQMGAIKSIDGDMWCEEYPMVISGHIHDTQSVGKVFYPGAPLQHGFGDSNKRIICSINSSDENMSIVEHPIKVPKKHIIKTDIKNIGNVKDSKGLDKIKIKLDATQEEFKIFKDTNEYKELISKGVKFQLQKKESKTIGLGNGGDNFLKILEELVEEDQVVKDLYYVILCDRMVIEF